MQTPEAPESMSLGARMANVFAAPGELFAYLARKPFAVANWLVPSVLVGLIGMVCMVAIFSQPALLQHMQELQRVEMERRVEQGAMTQEQAEMAAEQMRTPIAVTIIRVATAVSAFIISFIRPFWWGLLGWLVARLVFHERLGFMRAVEVAALASLIEGLSMIVGALMSIGAGSLFAGPHLGFFIENFDARNRLHLALGAFNPFNFWQLALLALGIARMIGRSWGQVGGVLLVIYVVYKGLAVVFRLSNFAF